MLSNAYEFVRTADPNPNSAVVSIRRDAAAELAGQLSGKQARDMLLACIQATIVGFDETNIAVAIALKAVHGKEPAFPSDLKENAMALRAVAALAVGEVINSSDKAESLTAAIALRGGLYNRQPSRDKHVRTMLQLLYELADQRIVTGATTVRQRAMTALRKLEKLEEPSDDTSVWKSLFPAIRSTVREIHAQLSVDREEIETLWWLFQAYSDFGRKPISKLTLGDAILCVGTELADRAVLPPFSNALELVRRALECERKISELSPLSAQDLINNWDEAILKLAFPDDGPAFELSKKFPALFPFLWAGQRRRAASGAKVGKEFSAATKLSLSYSVSPANWACQVFHERILLRTLVETVGV